MTLLSRTVGLDPSKFASDTQVQQWLGPCGMRKSLPTNVVDPPDILNVNLLRSKKMVSNGGQSYGPSVCIENWVEERRDQGRENGEQSFPMCESRKRLYSTEYQGRNAEAWPNLSHQRPHRATAAHNDYRCVFNKSSADYIFYAKQGFGSGSNQDATIPSRQGASWVGISPTKTFESVSQSAAKQERLEFQRPDTLSDPLLKIKTCSRYDDGESTHATKMESSQAPARGYRNWSTSYNAAFTDHMYN